MPQTEVQREQQKLVRLIRLNDSTITVPQLVQARGMNAEQATVQLNAMVSAGILVETDGVYTLTRLTV